MSLAYPPEKVSQETHDTFWGRYKWPYPQYNRFQLCAGLEKTADETHHMTAAFSNLSEVMELGLSLDSGLGWLAGPDISDRARIFSGKTKVFGPKHTLPDAAARERMDTWHAVSVRANTPFTSQIVNQYKNISWALGVSEADFYGRVKDRLEQRVVDDLFFMGSREWQWHMQSGFGEMLGSVGVSTGELPPVSLRAPVHEIQPEPAWVAQAQVVYQALSAVEACQQAASSLPVTTGVSDNEDNSTVNGDDMAVSEDEDTVMSADELDAEDDELDAEDDEFEGASDLAPVLRAPPLIFEGVDFNTALPPAPGSSSSNANPFTSEPLIPNNLSTAQKEWLLETEWAQRAFLASYTLAVMDNVPTFQNVRTFTIAKLSSRYLSPLHRQDFWAALPNVDTVTIIVSPDWRDIVKEHEGYVADPMLSPSEATGALYRLVQDCIAPLKNVTKLTLGFIGGGERATGLFARNKNILAAPIMENPLGQLEIAGPTETLKLPYVEDLTFNNCWFGPRALKTFVTKMRQANLRILKLDSVSLTAQPTVAGQNAMQAILHGLAHPIPPQAAVPAAAAAAAAAGAHAGAPGPAVGPATQAQDTSWLTENPRLGSWGYILDKITPGATIEAQRAIYDVEREAPAPRNNGFLQRVEFVSCGYVRLEHMQSFYQEDLGQAPRRDTNPHLVKRQALLEFVMMSSRRDPQLGRIQPFMKPEEVDVVENAFGMTFGWGEDPAKFEPLEDDEPVGGTGRFSGTLERASEV